MSPSIACHTCTVCMYITIYIFYYLKEKIQNAIYRQNCRVCQWNQNQPAIFSWLQVWRRVVRDCIWIISTHIWCHIVMMSKSDMLVLFSVHACVSHQLNISRSKWHAFGFLYLFRAKIYDFDILKLTSLWQVLRFFF